MLSLFTFFVTYRDVQRCSALLFPLSSHIPSIKNGREQSIPPTVGLNAYATHTRQLLILVNKLLTHFTFVTFTLSVRLAWLSVVKALAF